jgi:hypothetical protein
MIQVGSLYRNSQVGACPRKFLEQQAGIGWFLGARSGSFLFCSTTFLHRYIGFRYVICKFRVFPLKYGFSIRFLYISISGTIMVTSGIIISFRMRPVSSRHIWVWSVFGHFLHLYIFSEKCFFFYWFPCSGLSRVFSCPPWRPLRKISTDSPDFEFRY